MWNDVLLILFLETIILLFLSSRVFRRSTFSDLIRKILSFSRFLLPITSNKKVCIANCNRSIFFLLSFYVKEIHIFLFSQIGEAIFAFSVTQNSTNHVFFTWRKGSLYTRIDFYLTHCPLCRNFVPIRAMIRQFLRRKRRGAGSYLL